MNRGFEFLDKELDQLFPPDNDNFQPRYVDKLVKVFTRTGDEAWILVHVEVQGYSDRYFAQRMFTYYYRIWDKYARPITAFAILTDASRRFHPRTYERSYLGTELRYAFNTYKIIDQPDDELAQNDNPFAVVVQTVKLALLSKGKRMTGDQLMALKVELAKRLLAKQIPKAKIRVLMDFLRYYVRFGEADLYRKFDEQLDVLTNKTKTMGLEEFLLDRATKQGEKKGEKKGIDQAKKTFVQKLLLKTTHTDEQIADLADVDKALVAKERKKLKRGTGPAAT